MKKLRVVAMAESRDELLKGLLHLGCVEISEPEATLEAVHIIQRVFDLK